MPSLLQLRTDSKNRIERGQRALQDNANLAATQGPELSVSLQKKILASEADLALNFPPFKGSSPRIVRAIVLLPEPLSPTRPRISPGSRSNEIFRRTPGLRG